jgi:predicted GIY-YIG superfamily endonuclease
MTGRERERVLRLHDDQWKPGRALYWCDEQVRRPGLGAQNHVVKGFTSKYKLDRLVYYEQFSDAVSAITWEKEIKSWRREKKNELVRTLNPKWEDLAKELFDGNV